MRFHLHDTSLLSQRSPRDVLTFLVPGSKAGTTYRVHQLPDGRWTCACPDFYHRGGAPGYQCKHITKIRAQLAEDVEVSGGLL